MTDFEMDKTYTITGREFLALLSLIPDGTEKAKAIVENVAGREKSAKVNESQIDFLKPCPFCGGSPKSESDPHRKEFGRDRFRIVCSSCYAGTRWYDSPNEAWLMWNGRVSE